jgi:hypothetical protein
LAELRAAKRAAKDILKRRPKATTANLEQYAQELDAQEKDMQTVIENMVPPQQRLGRLFRGLRKAQWMTESLE